MRIAQINVTCGSGSTGKICLAISELLNQKNIDNRIFYSQGTSDYNNAVLYMRPWEVKNGALEARIRGNYGFNSRRATKRLVSMLRDYAPDVIFLHNIHGHNCALDLLFGYIRKEKIKLIWTFHDCWAFTGSCTYFTYAQCENWKTQCSTCPKAHEFSWFFDTSAELFGKKKLSMQGLDMTIVTPSQWLADQVKQSFFKDYPVKVINNGIDLDVFKPTDSNFRERYGIASDKIIVLGVAFGWGVRKGLDVFVELAKRLDGRFQIVLVGTDDKVDKQLPDNIISIHRTQNQQELAGIYTVADVFVNPTREDNYPTVNMEAIACGTPVITFETGGSPEMIGKNCGCVVPCNDVDALDQEILRVCTENPYSKKDCVSHAQNFDMWARYEEYVELYKLELDKS